MNADASNPVLHFGREVQRARMAAGMTLAEFGRVVGYHKSQVSRVERGVRAPTASSRRCATWRFPSAAAGSPLPRGQPTVVSNAALVPQLDRAGTTRGQPTDMATFVTVRAAANRSVRTGATADLSRRHGRAGLRAAFRADGPAGDPHP